MGGQPAKQAREQGQSRKSGRILRAAQRTQRRPRRRPRRPRCSLPRSSPATHFRHSSRPVRHSRLCPASSCSPWRAPRPSERRRRRRRHRRGHSRWWQRKYSQAPSSGPTWALWAFPRVCRASWTAVRRRRKGRRAGTRGGSGRRPARVASAAGSPSPRSHGTLVCLLSSSTSPFCIPHSVQLLQRSSAPRPSSPSSATARGRLLPAGASSRT